jgi:hypothetical protein
MASNLKSSCLPLQEGESQHFLNVEITAMPHPLPALLVILAYSKGSQPFQLSAAVFPHPPKTAYDFFVVGFLFVCLFLKCWGLNTGPTP